MMMVGHDEESGVAAADAEPDGGAQRAGAPVIVVVADRDQRGITRARELHEPHSHRPRERWRAVEHDEPEPAAA